MQSYTVNSSPATTTANEPSSPRLTPIDTTVYTHVFSPRHSPRTSLDSSSETSSPPLPLRFHHSSIEQILKGTMSQQTDFLIQSLIGAEDATSLRADFQPSTAVEAQAEASLPRAPRPTSLSKFEPLLDNTSLETTHTCPQPASSSSAETLYTVTKLYLPPPTTTCNVHTNNETLPTLFNAPCANADTGNASQTDTASPVITPEAQFSTLAVFSTLEDSNIFLASISATNKASIESIFEYTHNGCLVSQQTLPDGAVVSLKVEKVTSGLDISASVDGAADAAPPTLRGGEAEQLEASMTKKEKADLDKKAKSDKKAAEKAEKAEKKVKDAAEKAAEKAKKSEKPKKETEVTFLNSYTPAHEDKKIEKTKKVKKVETIKIVETVERVDKVSKSKKEKATDAPSGEPSSHQNEKIEKFKKSKKADKAEKKDDVHAPSHHSHEQFSHIHEEEVEKTNKLKKAERIKKDASINVPSGHTHEDEKIEKTTKSKKTDKTNKETSIDVPSGHGHSHEHSSHAHEEEKADKIKKSKKVDKVKKDVLVDDPSHEHSSEKKTKKTEKSEKDKKAELDKKTAENVKKAEEELKAEKARKAEIAKKAAEKNQKAEQEKKAEDAKKAAEQEKKDKEAKKEAEKEKKSKKSDKSTKEPSINVLTHEPECPSYSQDDKQESKKNEKKEKHSGLSECRARREARKSEKAEKVGKEPSSNNPDDQLPEKSKKSLKKGPKFGKPTLGGCCPHSHDKTGKFKIIQNPGELIEKVKKDVLSHVPLLGCLSEGIKEHSQNAQKEQEQRNADFEKQLSAFQLGCGGCSEETRPKHGVTDTGCEDDDHNVIEESDEDCGLCEEEEQVDHDCEGCRQEGKKRAV